MGTLGGAAAGTAAMTVIMSNRREFSGIQRKRAAGEGQGKGRKGWENGKIVFGGVLVGSAIPLRPA